MNTYIVLPTGEIKKEEHNSLANHLMLSAQILQNKRKIDAEARVSDSIVRLNELQSLYTENANKELNEVYERDKKKTDTIELIQKYMALFNIPFGGK